MEKFLDFWSHYNAAIIECLVALILISVIYIAYRTFFGPRGPDAFDAATVGTAGSGVGMDTTQIEKTLQKILEQQKAHPAAAAGAGKVSADGTPASAELIHEVSHLKKTLEERDRQISTLKEQADTAARALAAATNAADGAAAAVAAPAATPAGAGFSEAERAELLAKIKELEARLAEYEIISEDIADVSFFKEENARLNRELEALKGGGAVAAAPAAPTPAAEPVAAAVPEPPSAPAPAASEAAAEPPAAETPAAAAELDAAASPEASAEAANAIDDSLMAEFARAVEGQKEGTLEQPSKSDEDAKLLEEFENFSKKS